MSFLSDIAKTTKRVPATFHSLVTASEGSGKISETYAPAFTLGVFFWTGASAEKMVSEKIRPDVSGVIVLDYQTGLDENMRVEVGGIMYGIIYVENTAFQDEILVLPVKRVE